MERPSIIIYEKKQIQSVKNMKEPFSCLLKVVSIGKSEKEWESDGVLYRWCRRYEYTVTGNFKGTMTSMVSGMLDRSKGEGTGFGNSVLKVGESRWGSGTFELRWTCEVVDLMIVSGELIGVGSGEFDGWKLIGSFHDIRPQTRRIEGFILDYHG